MSDFKYSNSDFPSWGIGELRHFHQILKELHQWDSLEEWGESHLDQISLVLEEREEEIYKVLVEEEGFDYNCFEVFYVPNIVNITYGRDVGYKIEEETFDKEIEDISATKIRQERGL